MVTEEKNSIKNINIDKILKSIPTATRHKREKMRSNAIGWINTEVEAQRQAAERLIDALDTQEQNERNDLHEEIRGLDTFGRVIRAFTVQPINETEEMLIQVLLDYPGSTSITLTQALGWNAQSCHLHFGTMCKNRISYLWPAPVSKHRDRMFYSGILAEFAEPENLFTIKPDAAAAFAQLGLRKKT